MMMAKASMLTDADHGPHGAPVDGLLDDLDLVGDAGDDLPRAPALEEAQGEALDVLEEVLGHPVDQLLGGDQDVVALAEGEGVAQPPGPATRPDPDQEQLLHVPGRGW